MAPRDLAALVRTVPDFPVPGIVFRDITTLIAHRQGFAACVDWLALRARAADAEAIAGVEARGFIFGAAVAARLELGFVPLRKPGKLPIPALGLDYALEYGTDRLEIDSAALTAGQRVVLVDDLIASGGTACAAAALLRLAGAEVALALFVIDLPDLGGMRALAHADVTAAALLAFPGA